MKMAFYKPNPLLLPNIVNNIIQHFDDECTLQSFRLVCRCWNLEASTLLRRFKCIKFCSETSLKEYTDIFKNTYGIFGTFCHCQYEFSYRYDLNQTQDFKNRHVLPEAIQDFLTHFGHRVAYMKIPIGPGSFEPPLFDLILTGIPNITELSLYIHYFRGFQIYEFSEKSKINLQSVHNLSIQIEGLEMSEECAIDLLSIMFQYMTNLKRISCPGDIRRISKVGILLRDIILDSETASNLKRLCDWEFKTRLLEDDALKLLCKEFPMKMLHIDLWNPDDEFDCISSDLLAGLLIKWDETLEQFSVDFPWRKEVAFHFRFPTRMQNLKFLYLGGFEGVLLDLLRFLPCLNRLELSQLELASILPKPGCDDVYTNMKQLRLDFCTGQSVGIMSRFSRIFPELRSLNINHTTNEVARAIFQKMTNLVRLRLQGNDLTDAGMCGFSESAVKDKDMMAVSPTQGSHFKKYPSIADLKELQYLKLDAYSLTEVTVRHGLVYCTSLKLVKMDCTASRGYNEDDTTTTICRKFKLADYRERYHLKAEDEGKPTLIEMKEEPPLEDEAIAFFRSHEKYSADLANFEPY